MASPVFKTAWAAVRSPEGSTPFLLRQHQPDQRLMAIPPLGRKPAAYEGFHDFANRLLTHRRAPVAVKELPFAAMIARGLRRELIRWWSVTSCQGFSCLAVLLRRFPQLRCRARRLRRVISRSALAPLHQLGRGHARHA